MTLPAEVQPLVDQLRALLGLPACQVQINIDKAGTVQGVQAMMTFSRQKATDGANADVAARRAP